MPDGSSNAASSSAPRATAFPPPSETKGRSVPTYWSGRRQWQLDHGLKDFPNIGNLWRVGDNLYDLSEFNHPGGQNLLEMSRGTDITEAFESHHLDMEKVRKVLEKYLVAPATWPRESPLTFEPDGFYSVLRERVNAKVKQLGKGPLLYSKIINDLLAAGYVVSTLLASRRRSYGLGILAAFLQALTVTAAHNFGHRNNWRRYYLDLGGRSSTIWRIHHEQSHHMYPNSSLDIEVPGGEYAMDASFSIDGPRSTNSPSYDAIRMFLTYLYRSISPTFLHPLQHMEKIEFVNHLFLPINLYLRRTSPVNKQSFLSDALFVLGQWTLGRAAVAGWILFTGVLAGHYNSDSWRQGEEAPKLEDISDFGLFQIETTGDRTEMYSGRSALMLPITLTSFGDHTLHHLFPALDHAYHPALYNILAETCNEFNVRFEIRSTNETLWSVVEQVSRKEKLEAPRRTGWDGRYKKGWVDEKAGFVVGLEEKKDK